MSDEQKYTIQGLNEYIRQGEPRKRERGEAWKVAIGLQQVDRLRTSEYLLDTAKRHIDGDISISEAKLSPKVQITEFKVWKMARSCLQSAKNALWGKWRYFA